MHHSVPVAPLGLLPSMYPFCVPASPLEFDLGPQVTAARPHRGDFPSWELRCLRKQRRRDDAEVCSAKRRRLMQTDGENWDTCAPSSSKELSVDSCSSVVSPLPCPVPTQTASTPDSQSCAPDSQSSCMEVEAAQRRLREIEDRITLEDDSDSDLDLEVEVCPRRPVLVLLDSLKEGLQRGLSDILPHTVAQSVSHSCMELVLWRPPDAPFSHCLKDCIQKPQKQQSAPRPPPTPTPAPSLHSPSPRYSCPGAASSGDEEDMEMEM